MRTLAENRRRCGFTLIELMVVLVLIAVLSGVMIAEMSGTFEDALLRSTAREVMSACAIASSRSITILQPHTLVLDPRENRYAIERPARDEENASSMRTLRDAPGGEGALDERITVAIRNPLAPVTRESEERTRPTNPEAEERTGTITFYPDGTADAREIVLRDRAGVELILRVNPVTARVRVVKPEEG